MGGSLGEGVVWGEGEVGRGDLGEGLGVWGGGELGGEDLGDRLGRGGLGEGAWERGVVACVKF